MITSQEVSNNLARLSIVAMAKLGGFSSKFIPQHGLPTSHSYHTPPTLLPPPPTPSPTLLQFPLHILLAHTLPNLFLPLPVSTEEKTPENRNVQNVLRALLTPYLTKLISRETTNEVGIYSISYVTHTHTHILQECVCV